MKVKETRRIHRDDIRQLCIKKHWCYACFNEEFQILLDYGDYPNITKEHIAEMAILIDKYTFCNDYSGKLNEIAFEISKICYNFFDITKEPED